ncbi:hypothetical protein [Aliihoeflea sp.]|uniref:hypothetical protein n=2 Tax=Aliihoeflea sp. TaxID=2608088 RepID=UPI0040344E9B
MPTCEIQNSWLAVGNTFTSTSDMYSSDGETARVFLEHLRRSDLAALLAHAWIEYGLRQGAWSQEPFVEVRAPYPFAEALHALPRHDRKRIAEAVVSKQHDLQAADDIDIREAGDAVEGQATLLPELIIHRAMMIAVATGEKNIQEVDDYYMARQARLMELCAAAGITYENPHGSLWDWFHYWKSEGLDSWAQRRQYVRNLFASPMAASIAKIYAIGVVAEREPTGWDRVDRSLAKARQRYDAASAEEDWQVVGLLCREVLISLAQAVHDPGVHPASDDKGVLISRTDARRLLDAWLHHEMPGGNNKEIRAHTKASLDLAVNLQHRRTATRQLAALCLEATSSAVAVVAILAGRGL